MSVFDATLPRELAERELELVMVDASPGERADALAITTRAAKRTGAGVAQIAATTGLSRQGVYDALRRRPTKLPSGMKYVIAATVAHHAETPDSLASVLAVEAKELRPVLRELEAERVIKVAVANDDTQVLLAGDNAGAALRERLDDHAWIQIDAYAIYVRLSDGEGAKISSSAARVFGEQKFVILRKGIAQHVRTDELAFSVAADDRREALGIAQEQWDAVREGAGLPLSTLPLADIIDPARRPS